MASEAVSVAINALIALEDLRLKQFLNDQDVRAVSELRGLLQDQLDQLQRNGLDSKLKDSLDFLQRTLDRIGRAVRANRRRPWLLRFVLAGDYRQELLAATNMLQAALAAHSIHAIYVVLLNQQEAHIVLQEQQTRLDRLSLRLREQGRQQHTEQPQRNQFTRWYSRAESPQQTHRPSSSPSPSSSSSSSSTNTMPFGHTHSAAGACGGSHGGGNCPSITADAYLAGVTAWLQDIQQELQTHPADTEALSDLLLLLESHCDVMQQSQQQQQWNEQYAIVRHDVADQALDTLMLLLPAPPGAGSFLASSSCSNHSSTVPARRSSDLAANALLHQDTVPALAAAVWAPWPDIAI